MYLFNVSFYQCERLNAFISSGDDAFRMRLYVFVSSGDDAFRAKLASVVNSAA
jgi:hypothetical protein